MQRQDWINFEALGPPIGVLFAFAFGLFAGPTMSPLAQWLWIAAALAVTGFTWRGTARSCWAGRMADGAIRERLADIPKLVIEGLTNKDLLETILQSKRSATEKVEELNKYAVAAKVFQLVDEINGYLQNNKIARGRFRPPVWLGSIPTEQTPEFQYAQRYKAEYGQRLKEVIENLVAIGVMLPQAPERYYDPSVYSWVPRTIDQLKQAASLLVADLIQEAGLRLAGSDDSINYRKTLHADTTSTSSIETRVIRGPKNTDKA